MTRLTTSRIKEIERTIEVLLEELRRYPTNQEIAERMGKTLEEVERVLVTSRVSFTSLDASIDPQAEEGLSLKDMLRDNSSPDPDSLYDRKELREALISSINQLPDRSKLVISLYYIDEVSPAEIAEIMDVSRSQVYKLHAEAILQLRTLLHSAYPHGLAVAGARS